MATLPRLNDGGGTPPRLRVQQSLWALGKLPMNAETEWSLDEKCARVKAAGFEGVECWLGDENEAEVAGALERHGLRLVLGHRPFTVEDVRKTVDRAVRLRADFVFGQPADAFTPLSDVVELVRAGMQMAGDAGFPFFVETHRNNFTENLPQTLALIEAVPDIRFTSDLSHFVVVGEFYGWKEERAIDRMMPVLERTSHLHGRIGNGEQVQVDVGDGSGATPQFFVSLWTAAMRHWLAGAGPGDVFPFTSELGPPRYAITLPDGKEFSDRWEQSLVMKRLAEQAWTAAQQTAV
ncbi:MAG TPA: sugar phosphate isomerase/epimerase [Armatimonadaceae bacterium]|nr:sugar phosphate isomerase/epimerase [Armatimonadaceae bacterium]